MDNPSTGGASSSIPRTIGTGRTRWPNARSRRRGPTLRQRPDRGRNHRQPPQHTLRDDRLGDAAPTARHPYRVTRWWALHRCRWSWALVPDGGACFSSDRSSETAGGACRQLMAPPELRRARAMSTDTRTVGSPRSSTSTPTPKPPQPNSATPAKKLQRRGSGSRRPDASGPASRDQQLECTTMDIDEGSD